MGYRDTSKKATELWAVLNLDKSVCWTRGGSYTPPKLMVYKSESLAKRVVASPWINLKPNTYTIECIYKVEGDE